MKKVLFGALALALLVASPALAKSNDKKDTRVGTTTDLVCMQSAVEKRDNTLGDAWDAFGSTMNSAMHDRRDALKEAWGISDKNERNQAIRSAWESFRSTHKSARKDFNTERKDAWKVFKTDRKACGMSASDTSGERESDDNL